MLLDKDSFSQFVKYIENSINFSFLSKIPGYDEDYKTQKEAILKLIKTSNNNDAFLDYISYTYTLLRSDIIEQIISLSWEKPNGMKDSFINDDKFELNINEKINYISILLVIRDIMHTSYIASLPIYNEYKYNQKEFYDKAKEMIENAVDNISTLGNINPIFIAIAAKSILPFSMKNDELSSSSKLIAILFNISRIIGSYPYSEYNNEKTQPIFLSAVYNLTNNASFLGLDYKMIRQLYDKVKCGEIRWKN